ncbi:acireductone dioxygenase, partial [Bacillus cereus]|nr:acireductone dioxygenase [Bacillus cereus]
MSQIRLHEGNTRIENEVEVSKCLQEEGVLYEKWNISKLPTHLIENYSLTDENKAEILAVFSKEIA